MKPNIGQANANHSLVCLCLTDFLLLYNGYTLFGAIQHFTKFMLLVSILTESIS